ncbi:MAG: suppressor of fused domain protein [Cytophagales bacterium]|nr:suppressor of fused domain protein [Cytophaga sp.]
MPNRLERFIEHIEKIFLQEPEIFHFEPASKSSLGGTVFVYHDVPEPGYLTAVTYGLSLYPNKAWVNGRPELIISIESTDINWAKVLGFLVSSYEQQIDFSYGEVLNFGEKISNDSNMDSFFIFAPSILERSDFADIDALEYKINLTGIYPIYSNEIKTIDTIGLEAFMKNKDYDLYSVTRKAIV